MAQHIIVIGAGQAGQSVVTTLRARGFDGQITLIGEEPVPPYQRPPLSKAYLLGKLPRERLFLRPAAFYDEHDITLRLGEAVAAIDRDAQTLRMAGGDVLTYDKLVLTTGAAPRRLPADAGGTLGGVFTLRTLADIDAMAPEFVAGRRLLVVGGGYIGLEAAAVAAKLGLHVDLVEAAPRILQRVAAPETSDYFRALHTAHGVRIHESTALVRLLGDDGHVRAARLADGRELAADFVLLGLGITPASELAQAAGLRIENGIATDAFGATSDPLIYAAGDCASFPHGGQQIRLESVGNAIDQGEVVAQNLLGAAIEYRPHPWFWSDQYDVKLQIAGLSGGQDRVVIRHGDDGALSHWYYAGERLIAVDAMNDARAYMVAKRLIEAGKSPLPDVVENPAIDLKTLLKA